MAESKVLGADVDGRFHPEPIEMLVDPGLGIVAAGAVQMHQEAPIGISLLETPSSFHVMNFNSPGATGAPVFSALVVKRLRESGALDGMSKRTASDEAFWSYGRVLRLLEGAGNLT